MAFKRDYRVSINKDDWVAPEETLVDSTSDYSDLEKPISDFVFKLLSLIFIVLGGIIFAFTFKLSVVDSEELKSLAIQNSSTSFKIPPPRGTIFDRSGKALTKNIPSFDLLAVTKEINESEDLLDTNIIKIAEVLNLDVETLKNEVREQLKSNSIFFIARDLSKKQLLEIDFMNPVGFYIITDTKRNYLNGPQFAQIIGYVGKVSKEDLAKDNYYLSTDFVGRAGIESQYEKELRGEHGVIFFKNSEGNKVREGEAGNSIVLNINYDLQAALYSSLYNELSPTALDKAAAIVQNPQNGEVLAMVSFPSYDNNVFQDGLSSVEFKRLFANDSKPLFNRVIGGTYNPGSTIKPFMGMAILQENVFNPTDNIRDCVSLTIPSPTGQGRVFKNWRPETGLFNLRKAIANSCNVYFFIGGGGFGGVEGLGVNKIANYLKKALADSILGIDLPGEASGFVPTPAWKETERGEDWYQGDTYNISIGQGDLSVTPLWINTYVSAIANGGSLFKPWVANRIVDGDNNTLIAYKPEILGRLPFKESNISEMKFDMEETVISGTAKLLSNVPVRVGAKTGTAEVIKGKRINSLFTAFAPLENSELALTILVEGSASNEGYAIRAADTFLKWYFDKQKSKVEQPATETQGPSL